MNTCTRTCTRTHTQNTCCVRNLRCGLLPRECVTSVSTAFALSPFRSLVDLDERLQNVSLLPASYILLKRIFHSCHIGDIAKVLPFYITCHLVLPGSWVKVGHMLKKHNWCACNVTVAHGQGCHRRSCDRSVGRSATCASGRRRWEPACEFLDHGIQVHLLSSELKDSVFPL